MILCEWDKLPDYMRNDEVKEYYDILSKKKVSLVIKRAIDIILSAILIVLLIVPMAVIAILVKCDSKGPVLFKQVRVTTYGKRFKILHIMIGIYMQRLYVNLKTEYWMGSVINFTY